MCDVKFGVYGSAKSLRAASPRSASLLPVDSLLMVSFASTMRPMTRGPNFATDSR